MTVNTFPATTSPSDLTLGPAGRRAAQVATGLTVAGAVTIATFFTVGEPWGTINDWTSIGLAAATVPIAVGLARRESSLDPLADRGRVRRGRRGHHDDLHAVADHPSDDVRGEPARRARWSGAHRVLAHPGRDRGRLGAWIAARRGIRHGRRRRPCDGRRRRRDIGDDEPLVARRVRGRPHRHVRLLRSTGSPAVTCPWQLTTGRSALGAHRHHPRSDPR